MVWCSEAQDEKKLKYILVVLAPSWLRTFASSRCPVLPNKLQMCHYLTMTGYRLEKPGLSLGVLSAVADRHGDRPEDQPEVENRLCINFAGASTSRRLVLMISRSRTAQPLKMRVGRNSIKAKSPTLWQDIPSILPAAKSLCSVHDGNSLTILSRSTRRLCCCVSWNGRCATAGRHVNAKVSSRKQYIVSCFFVDLFPSMAASSAR
ncbi:hypothetical protein BDV97DRAFT_137575 [Delphinella strobiligena]|nr:hypothetical protein BDV97DRAFT_137575 [Delphinella strobiligena]